jgi:hypothetical protein
MRGRKSKYHHDKTSPPPIPLAACPVCLGRNKHNISECNAKLTWNGNVPKCYRNPAGQLIHKDSRLALCINFQRPTGCNSTSHLTKHICAGCGGASHGVQGCPDAQPSTPPK